MPTRYLKPGIRDSELIDKLSSPAEVLFYRLIVTVDDFGRTDARPAMIKAACFPIKESATASKCGDLLAELARVGLIDLYEADGKPYLQMRKWDNPPRAKTSKFPAPADGCMQVHAGARKPRALLPGTETGTETETGKAQRKRRAAPTPVDKPEDVDGQVWADWLLLRDRKKAPVTATVLAEARKEAGKAGMTLDAFLRVWCRRGSQGLEAAWLKGDERAPTAADPDDWRASWRTISAKGLEVGCGEWSEELFAAGKVPAFPIYRQRVEKRVAELESGPVDAAGQAKVAEIVGGLFAGRKTA